MRCLVLAAACLLVAACGRLPILSEPAETTLADLQPVAVPDDSAELPQVGLEQLAQIYRQALEENQDTQARLVVLHRLADLEMLSGEAELAASDSDRAFFQEAIAAYESLLRENPDYRFNDRILYQLSRAYDLSGQGDTSLAVLERLSTQYPESPYLLEAAFRGAESYFIDGDYGQAEMAYTRVIAHGPDTAYFTRALYMQGWSRFKQDRYRASIAAFTGTLDQLVPADNRLQDLPRGERELVQDTLRVLAVVFSYLEGTQTIASAYEQLGVRPYQHLLYESLGMLYLSQERYRDSAETYQSYTRRFPESRVAHLFQMRVIEAFEAGGFPDLIISAKQDYVASFGVFSDYWLHSDADARQLIGERLQSFIEELASYYHALAQSSLKDPGQATDAADYYVRAGDYYQLFIDSFPEHARVPHVGFLLAESRFEARDYAAAVIAYEWVAYRFADYKRAHDAGYNAILAYQQLTADDVADADEMLRLARINSELRFASTFSDDPRASPVLAHAASELLQLQHYEAAIAAASTLTAWQPVPGPDILVPAYLALGHSHFELQQYAVAEQAYQQALARMGGDDQRQEGTVERLAASVYRQAEDAAGRGDDLAAAAQFQRVGAVAPGSAIRVNAQYDAAAAYMRAGDLEAANRLLLDFRQRYAGHELSRSISTTLVANYEQMGQWRQAAIELDTIHASQADPAVQREALYLAAGYYDRVGERSLAIARYRRYAEDWPQPFDEAMEAMNRLAELYQRQGNSAEQRVWLERMVQAHDGAGAAQSDRSRYLAASCSSVLAADAYERFQAVKLHYPIRKSLGSKKQFMEQALAAWQKTNDYAIEQFSTLATLRMGQIYQQLSADLINSDRPENLDALALEQYELLLEEQAFPFEEKAIAIHESNARRSWDGVYDEWVQESFSALARLLPARYAKQEDSAIAAEGVAALSYPSEVDELNQQAIALRKDGRFEAAQQVYLQSLALWEPHPATHRNLGILYDLYRGQQDRALQHFNRYQALTEGADRVVAGWIADLERRRMMLVRRDF